MEDKVGDELGSQVLGADGFALLDLKLTDSLLAEGYARDMVRLVQDERKAAGLHVTDRIALALAVPAPWVAAVETHAEMIQRETLARSLAIEVSATDVAGAKVAKAS
jgi:isoleucyl-tRNA synthetase